VFTRAHDKNILSLLRIDELIDRDVQMVDINAHLREVIELVKEGGRNIIAVVSQQQLFEGIITLDDIRPVMFNPELYDTITVKKMMQTSPAVVNIKDNVDTVIRKFDGSNTWLLPVLQDKHLVGFISKSTLLNKYRLLLQEYSEG
jgi:CIC family chloride channel protein